MPQAPYSQYDVPEKQIRGNMAALRSGPRFEEKISNYIHHARRLLNVPQQQRYQWEDYQAAKQCLVFFRIARVTHPETVNLSLDLHDRVLREVAARISGNNIVNDMIDQHDAKATAVIAWACRSKFFTPLLSNWKHAVRFKRDVYAPHLVLDRLLQLKTMLSKSLQLDMFAIGNVVDAAIHSCKDRAQAPYVGEDMIRVLHEYAQRTNDLDMVVTGPIYQSVLRAWAENGDVLPEARYRVEALFKVMQLRNVRCIRTAYNLLLQFWANAGESDRCAIILAEMQDRNIAPDTVSHSHIVRCYCTAGLPDLAETVLFRMMVKMRYRNLDDRAAITDGAWAILCSYRDVAAAESSSLERAKWTIESAEILVHRCDVTKVLDYRKGFRGT
jgi:pentatricopeptide repeat protein